LKEVSASHLSRILPGLAYIRNGVGESSRMIDQDARVQLMHEHVPFILWCNNFVSNDRLTRVGVVGAMYSTWLKDSVEATEFWTQVKEESHPNPKHPTRVLARHLRDTQGTGIGPGSRTKGKWTIRSFYVKSLHAWNASRKGVRTALTYKASKPIPKIR